MGCGQSNSKSEIKCNQVEMKQKIQEHNTLGPISPVARSKSIMEMFMTNKERTVILNMTSVSPSTRLLLSPPFSNFSSFNQQLYLTAIGGVTLDNLKQYNIKCLINVAEEIPALELSELNKSSLLYFKYPVSVL